MPGTYVGFRPGSVPDDARLAEFARDLKAVTQPLLLDLRDCTGLTAAGLAPVVGADGVAGVYLKGPGLKDLIPTVSAAPRLRYLQLVDDTLADADVAPVAALVHLRGLVVVADRRAFTAAAYRCLADMTELELLGGSFLPPHVVLTDAALGHVGKLAKLKAFDIRPDPAADLTDRGLANLKGMTGLTDLRIGLTPGVTAASLAVIGGLPNLTRLELTDENEWPWPRAGTANLRPLAGRLKTFKFDGQRYNASGTPPAPADAAWLGTVATFTRLEVLSLQQAGVGDADLTHLAGLADLQVLNLDGNPIAGPGLLHLRPLAKLTDVQLQGTVLTDAAAPAIKGLPPGVTTINVRGTRITGPVLDDLEKSRAWQHFSR